MAVHKASSQHPETAAESIQTDGPQSLSPIDSTTIQALLYGRSHEKQDDFVGPAKP